ncbi:MAG: sulfite exporter TauE/SafE family protein [Hyphomicrobiaceae bacterium]
MAGVISGDVALLVVALLLAGLASGFVAGLLGVGGGGVIVPALYEVFRIFGVDDGVRMHLTVGTALAVMGATSVRSWRAHQARGAVDGAVLRRLGPSVLVGVVIGVLVARASGGDVLKWVLVTFNLLMAAKLIFGRQHWRLGSDMPRGPGVDIYGIVAGLISTMMSIGGGIFISMMMTLYGRPIHQAVGTAAAFGPLITIPAALGFAWAGWGVAGVPTGSIGYVSLLGAAIIAPASVLAAPWGVRVSHGIARRTLEIAFGLYMLVIGLRFLASLVL